MRKHEDEMDLVVNALQTAGMMLSVLPNDLLDKLERAVKAAEDMAFIMVAPVEFNATTKRLEDQKKVLQWARSTVSIYKSMKE